MISNITFWIEGILSLFSHILAITYILKTGKRLQQCFMLLTYANFFGTICALHEYLQTFLFVENIILPMALFIALLIGMHYLLIKHLKPIVQNSSPHINKEWLFLYIPMVLFLCMILSFFIYPNKINSFTLEQATTLLLFFLVLLITYGVLFIFLDNFTTSNHTQQTALQLELLTVQIETQRKTIAEAKRLRHDIRHHNLTLLSLAKKGGIEPLISYLESITKETPPETETSWCENEILNSIFTVYSHKAQEKNITCDILSEAEQKLPIQATDLVAIVANLFENAIHGAANSNIKSPFIKIRIFYKGEKLVIRIDNSCHKSLHYEEEMPAKKYGIGLSNVLNATEHYDGELSLTASDGIFKAMVLLNLPI